MTEAATQTDTKTYSINTDIDNQIINVVQKVREELGTIDLNSINTENTTSRSADYSRILDVVFSELNSNEELFNKIVEKLKLTFLLNQPKGLLKAFRENIDKVNEVLDASP
tara:strand:+ start:853 stop:1185 length:333 start_codon:yes stop_codon:yes gene_type:complete